MIIILELLLILSPSVIILPVFIKNFNKYDNLSTIQSDPQYTLRINFGYLITVILEITFAVVMALKFNNLLIIFASIIFILGSASLLGIFFLKLI